MQTAHSIPQRFERQAEACASMGSAFYGALCLSAAHAYRKQADVRAVLDTHAERSRLVLRLLGAAHYRALRGEAPGIAAHYPSTGGDGNPTSAWTAILSDMRVHRDAYDTLLERQVQTNEVGRAMPVLAAMLALAQQTQLPLRIFEIGSSAGLILNFDRYGYAGEGWSWGDAASPLQLRNRTFSGRPQHLQAPLNVFSRTGCDLHPLDAANPEDADTLLGFVWPDQRERFARLKAAIQVARAHPVRIEAADGLQWIAQRAQPAPDAVTVALHTVMTEHLPPPLRERLAQTMVSIGAHAAARAPFAWVRMEPGQRGYETRVTLWPGPHEILIASSDGHAQDLRWAGGGE